MKNQVFNPYMPAWEYVPDGEPHVFGDRVYVYGSHDLWNGHVFCLGDYVCYSAPITDLTDWRYEGVIYTKKQDPAQDGRMVLYAPDVTVGPDGRYYLYYVMDKVSIVSVAVCDTPAGKYEFYGYVHYKDGTRLGDRKGDMPQFDPAVITEGNKTYLYTGFCGNHMKDRIGAMATVLDADMLTILEEPVVIAPGDCYTNVSAPVEIGCPYKQDSVEAWKDYAGHAFFEAPSIRKIGDTYYFVFSSQVMHELAYATSKNPTGGFRYKGVIVSNADIGIDSYKPADMPAAYGANNHGGFEFINGEYYIFYHRHTNNTWYSRQGCAEKIKVLPDGTIPQVEITSCGLNGGPLEARGKYGMNIACNMFVPERPSMYVGTPDVPRIMQDGVDGDENVGYIANITSNATIGFKYFKFESVKKITITTRGYFYGHYEVRTKWDGPAVGKIETDSSNFWEEYSGEVNIPDGVSALYLVFVGSGTGQLKDIKFTGKEDYLADSSIRPMVVDCPPEVSQHRKTPVGSVEHVMYHSETCKMDRPFNILLPASYDGVKKFPVVYFQHGIFGDENCMINDPANKFKEITSYMAADGFAEEMIIVFGHMYATDDPELKPGFNQKQIAPYDNYINELVNDLMPYVESHYAVLTGRENTAICGFSMGGRESLYIGLQRPDLFGYIGAIAPAPGLIPAKDWAMTHPGMMKENELKFKDGVELPKLLMVCCGTNDSVVGKYPLSYHNVFDQNKVEHLWFEVSGADHNSHAIRTGFFQFVQRVFK